MTGNSVSPGYTGGNLNLVGTRPGNAYKYDGPAMPNGIWFALTYTSTHDAIEKLIVPPGLKVNRDLPPEVEVQYFVNPECRAYDGRITPYQGFMFMAHVRHGDTTGRAGWEYVDGVHGDKTQMDIMGPWGVYFGMLKKMADIHFTPIGGNEFEISVTRRGVRLVTMTIRTGAEVPENEVELINAASSQWPRTLTVREIPDVDFSGFVERSVCIASTDNNNTITQAWTADKGSITFGNDELDPLNEMPVLGVSGEFSYKLTCSKELFSGMTVLEHLPLDAHAPVAANA
ncbi:acetoacetate decarboxylase family protein [Rhodococcus sp. NPDC127530]|uniref:acetoacetate decarboxylase family protein n=1 Tax=unclassified Rhodococcus (in: high G+C Gram-positive bacteria) TaxID=192944 RepID=UPI00362C010E